MSAETAALLTIEQRTRAQVSNRLSQAFAHISGYLAAVTRENNVLTGHELLSRPDVHGAITTVLAGAEESVVSSVRAGYTAAAKSARVSAAQDLAQYDYKVPEEIPELGPFLAAVVAGLAAAFAAAAVELSETVRAAYDGIVGAAATPARILAIYEAVNRALRRLSVRTSAAVTVAVNRGFSDAQHAIYDAYHRAHPTAKLIKRWRTTSADPCPACRALDGVAIDIDDEFDRTASTSRNWRPPPVYRDLLGPPRHPNCRCRLVYEHTDASSAARTQTTAAPAQITVSRLSAAEVRRMEPTRFSALLAFFTAAGRRLSTLIRRIAAGG